MSYTTVSHDLPGRLSPSKSPLQSFDNSRNYNFLSETPVHARGLPNYVRGKQTPGKLLVQGGTLSLNPFRSLVTSPATPETPTPAAQLGSGYGSEPCSCNSQEYRTDERP